MSDIGRVLAALDIAPSTRDELSSVTGVPKQSLGTYLSELCRMGLVERSGTVMKEVTFQRRVPMWKRIAA